MTDIPTPLRPVRQHIEDACALTLWVTLILSPFIIIGALWQAWWWVATEMIGIDIFAALVLRIGMRP